MKFYERLARSIHGQEHVRSEWQAHPNYKQSVDQQYRLSCARSLCHRIAEWTGVSIDPDMEVGNSPVMLLGDPMHTLDLIKSIQDALGTGESGHGLIEVARNAHTAEQQLAKQAAFEEGMAE